MLNGKSILSLSILRDKHPLFLNYKTMKEQEDKIEKFFTKVDKFTFKAVKIMAVFIPLYVLYQLIFNS